MLPVVVSYAMQLQSPPPYIEMALVSNVAGTTLADDAFWAEQCKTIPSNTLFIVVDMGAVRDFFKPIDSTTTYCAMLQTQNKHQWSPDGVQWFPNKFYTHNGVLYHNGGSEEYWPKNNVDGDERTYLSFWGDNNNRWTGGCCSTSTAVDLTQPSLRE